MRKRHTPDFKAKAVLETLKEERPLNQIASEYEVYPNMLSAWKSNAIKGLSTIFEKESKAQFDKEAHEKELEELYAQIGKLTTQLSWIKKNLALIFLRDERLEMLERNGSNLTLAEQANLLSVSRSSLYYVPRTPSEWEIRVKHRIDEIYTELPFYGSRRITHTLQEEGFDIGRDGVRQFMREMGIETIYPKPNLSKTVSENRIYPYLLRGVSSRYPNHIWGIDITYIRLRRSWMYLVAILDWY